MTHFRRFVGSGNSPSVGHSLRHNDRHAVSGHAARVVSPLRIAFLVGEFPSLSQTFVLNQITGLLDRGQQVDIYATAYGSPSTTHDDVYRYQCLQRTSYPTSLPLWRHLLRHPAVSLRMLAVGKPRMVKTAIPIALQGGHYDIIHAHFGNNGIRAAAYLRAGVLEGNLVTTFHGFDVSRVLARNPSAYSQLFATGRLFLPISEHWRSQLIAMGCPSDKTFVHRMGIDCRRFTVAARVTRELVKLVSVARLVEKKGLEYAIRAVGELIRSGYPLHYDIVGDGPLRPELETLIGELRIGDRVRIVGQREQTEVHRFLLDADIFLAPSVTDSRGDQEGIPVAIMEAMATGLPVVSTLHSGIPELVDHGRTGLLVPERDSVALVRALQDLTTMPDLRVAMGFAARVKVEADYNIDVLNDQLLDRFSELVDKPVQS